jgi:hypothetical protein
MRGEIRRLLARLAKLRASEETNPLPGWFWDALAGRPVPPGVEPPPWLVAAVEEASAAADAPCPIEERLRQESELPTDLNGDRPCMN